MPEGQLTGKQFILHNLINYSQIKAFVTIWQTKPTQDCFLDCLLFLFHCYLSDAPSSPTASLFIWHIMYFKRHFRGITMLFQCTQSHQMLSHWQLCISNNLFAPNQHQHSRFAGKASSFKWPENISQQKSWRSTKLIRKHRQWNNDQSAGTKLTHWLHRKNTLLSNCFLNSYMCYVSQQVCTLTTLKGLFFRPKPTKHHEGKKKKKERAAE